MSEKTRIVYNRLLAPIEGMNRSIAEPIITVVRDIRLFPKLAGFKTYCGVGVKKPGQPSGRWHPAVHKSLYLLSEEFSRRPNSVWGKKLLEYKAKFREKHPTEIEVNGKVCYNDAHIHKMASWRTRTKFVEWLWKEWWKLEGVNHIKGNHVRTR